MQRSLPGSATYCVNLGKMIVPPRVSFYSTVKSGGIRPRRTGPSRTERTSRQAAQGARPGAAAAIAASRQPRTMAETLSTATSYTEDDFYCPVCQEVFKTPVRTAACQHVFCRKCFLTAMRESGIHCPLCRGNVTRRERACPERALDIENVMRKFSGSCRCCAKQIKFYRMRHHYKSCKKYQDEYGVSSIIPNFQISQDSVGNSNRSETSTSDNTETYQGDASSPGHPTFKCPLCQEANFTRQRLLDHCNNSHLFQIVPVTCPICVSLPWGDPSQITRNFVSHLNQRHQFDYGEFVNLQLDEETQYQTAVEESYQVNF
ncbi:E3 ubiquitin-protein ligase RNF138 isoform X1 [Antechinus flavipes]|uniref:E3 ubiquitin-protein ligase RNF138 isoform X1 n=1 Tax=Antechinus flavipes TaxID=38775 RepID=UPI002235BB44|nr:E3 ubiquitin-protein ligase RNF138 isoform X1 [Antechinus flavipes]